MGSFAGMRLDELSLPQLLALLRECRAEDEEAARLLEAYLDRLRPDWRDELGGRECRKRRVRPGAARRRRYQRRGGLCDPRSAPGANAEAIKAAHHRLMMKLHPDHGGTDYLATKINRARDVLLHR